MDTLIGIKGDGFVVLAADSYASFSIYRMKNDEDKLMEIDGNKLLGLAGAIGDRNHFGEFIRKNIHLYRWRNNGALGAKATAHFTRQKMAQFLRENPYEVNCLMAGCDHDGAQLYWMDYLASMVPVEKAAHGHGAYFVGGLLDRYYQPNMTLDEAINILKMCVEELKSRFVISQFDFIVKVVDKAGVRVVKL